MSKKTYKDYFNIDPKYYAAVTADLIRSGQGLPVPVGGRCLRYRQIPCCSDGKIYAGGQR